MALARSQEGDRVGALQDLRRSATLLRHFDDSFGMSWCVESGALVCAAVGRHGDAAVLLGSAAGHRALPLAMAERLGRAAETVREALGEVEFDRLMADGAALSLRAAVDLVAGGPESSTSRREDSGAQPLSHREWEVAELVAAGRSNKEIAAALVISTRTAEGHVQRILGKLDFLSRAQIAAWVAEQRAVSQPDARGGRGSR
jgi:non-specific serine/threonine protein kinase